MARTKERTDIKVASEKAVLAAVHLPDSRFDERDPLGELRSLAETAGAVVVGELIQNRQRPEAGTYIGSGKLDELKGLCDTTGATLIVFDHDLSPSQIGNIEKHCERKVVDRSELILDIFASRATTHEAKLQVELAQLEYTFPRLRAMWDHLERIVGVGGVMGIGARGPGEQQLEIDRRIVKRKQTQLRRELEEIQSRKRREVSRRRRDHYTVGLVGYTNAGKSTLFNTLTAGGAYADDRLFATLMTRTREWDVGGGAGVMLSDTVGFVRDLPHNLIASFKATLEETTHADLLLIVLDVSDPSAEMQYETVMKTLDEIFEEVEKSERKAGAAWEAPERQLLLNKVDRLQDNKEILYWVARSPGAIPICARDPEDEGLETLRQRVREKSMGDVRELTLITPMADSKTINSLENRSEVLERSYDNGEARIRARIGSRVLDQLRAGGAKFEIEPAASGGM
ncbi:MAG: GTPase HflX [Phycisphaeraceae bacterium]|nr:MAG: GTPase HflX [Phycisphaeraceae bacterium]